ncbi:MAG: 3'-5' exoribonuclease [Cyanobacteria bacterium P01_F01_bin.150]
MRYFLDTEFIEDGKTIDLISIGIVCEDGRELYLCNNDCKFWLANEWVWENVLMPIGVRKQGKEGCMRPVDPHVWMSKRDIVRKVAEFFNLQIVIDTPSESVAPTLIPGQWHFELPDSEAKPEFWAYYAATDWVVFYQLFGRLIDLPKGLPRRCNDLMQECDRIGFDARSMSREGQHNALEDARWNYRLWRAIAQ